MKTKCLIKVRPTNLHYIMFLLSIAVLTTIGVIFDFLVWYYGRSLDLYSEDYEENNRKFHKSHKVAKNDDRERL